jgi:hypothetical protein
MHKHHAGSQWFFGYHVLLLIEHTRAFAAACDMLWPERIACLTMCSIVLHGHVLTAVCPCPSTCLFSALQSVLSCRPRLAVQPPHKRAMQHQSSSGARSNVYAHSVRAVVVGQDSNTLVFCLDVRVLT